MKEVFALTKALTTRYFRDKTALFFNFLFPVIFLLVFGFLNSGNSGARFDVAIFNSSTSPASTQFLELAKQTDILKIQELENTQSADDKISRSELDAYIVLPESFGQPTEAGTPSGSIELRYSGGSEQTGQALKAFLEAITTSMNQQVSPYTPPFVVTSSTLNINKVSRFDYALAGLLGFSLTSIGIFGVVNGFVGDKKTGSIARLRVTPLKAWQLVGATALNRVIVAIASIAIMLLVSALFFDFRMKGDWFSFVVVSILSSLCLFGIGLCLGGWAKSEEQAAPLANLVTFPMMFLSGAFFPVFAMPAFLQTISKGLPLTPIIDSFRLVLTEGRTIIELGPQLGLLLLWTMIAYIIANRVFRWE